MVVATNLQQHQQAGAVYSSKQRHEQDRNSSSSSPFGSDTTSCSQGNNNSNTNNPPSIVSLASDVFDTFTNQCNPEQLVPSTLSDLFEGTLCDDELNGKLFL